MAAGYSAWFWLDPLLKTLWLLCVCVGVVAIGGGGGRETAGEEMR